MRMLMKNSMFWVTISISFSIGIWLENDSGTFYSTYISPILNFPIPLIFFLIVAAAAYQYHSSKVTDYETQIADYESQVKDGSRALWKYFKDISDVKVREIVNDVMADFTKKHNHVLAVQIYEYSVKHLRKHTLFTVSHKYSFVSESTDINALLQTYYRIPKEIYDEYIRIKITLDQDILLERDITSVSNFCERHITHISSKPRDELTEEDAITCGLIEVILDKLSFRLHDRFRHTLTSEVLAELNSLKRTGILKGIEMGELYTFEYVGVSEKMGRKYLTETIKEPELFNGNRHIILITLHPEYLPENESEHQEVLWGLGKEFHDELQKELKMRYNDLKSTIG